MLCYGLLCYIMFLILVCHGGDSDNSFDGPVPKN